MRTSTLHTFKSILSEGIKIEGQDAPIEISCIYIPKIQRAYAQGRNEESDIRKDFLDVLFNILIADEEKSIELSFLFGSKQFVAKKSTEGFELLDGQQRTTTLFLLYWYVSMKEKECVPEFLSKFTYETRDTSTQFLSNITSEDSKISIKEDIPSDAIKNNKWFTDDYYCDPTVCAMLTMLDSIDELYRKHKCSNIFDNLERLKFYVLMLEKFDMNDELYIKMNSRGLSLIPFENFKASIVQYMRSKLRNGIYGTDEVHNGNPPFWFTFISNMDARWIDLFWKNSLSEEEKEQDCLGEIVIDDNLIGIRYFNFINRYLFAKAAIVDNLHNSKISSLTSFFYFDVEDEKMQKRLFGWENYNQIFQLYETSAKIEDTLFFRLQKVLNVFLEHQENIESKIKSDPYGRTAGFKLGTDKFNNLYERVVFAAVTEFIENIPQGVSFSQDNVMKNFERMLRVAFNIVENTLIENVEASVRVIKIFSAMNSAPNAITGNFYSSLARANLKSNNEQLKEEILKAKEMFSDESDDSSFIPEWEQAFITAESHPFFKGSILFFFTEKSGDSDAFLARYNLVKDMFDENGITSKYRENHILMRVLLSQLNTWKSFGNRYITEEAEKEKYLKNGIVRQDETRRMFCNYFDSNKHETPIAEYFKGLITNSKPQGNKSFTLLFNRLVKEAESKHIFDWINEREHIKSKKFYIQENRSSLVINIPGAWFDRMILDTERHKIIPTLVTKYSMEYDEPNQKIMMEGPIKDSFGWDISISKQIVTQSDTFTLNLTFTTWKWLDFKIYGENIDDLALKFKVPIERKHKNHVQLSSIEYQEFDNIQIIEQEIESIIRQLEQ